MNNVKREDLEVKINFLGFLIMENKMKKGTDDVIKQLNEARIRTVMATGDNILTAISVGNQCGFVNYETNFYLGDLVANYEGNKEV